MKKGLFALALGTFTLGMAEFIIEGILTDVAHNMNVSIPQVGHLISIYALGVCAGAFSLILMHKYRPKNILLFLTSLVVIGAIIATVAPNYWLLLCARFIQGLPHGAYFGTATIVAVKMAKEGKETKAVAMMCAGMPFAPDGCSARYISQSYDVLASSFPDVRDIGTAHSVYDLSLGT